ncbi:restriction endonuclease subunit S [Helicobacter pylori]|uniref:restriction endonuclease subunit S n=1 Tax=Helicobacter pylori TaxID=210 RepID=UPI000C31173E|nr:restriction endonuclease subunit S [Helicobacter pylori]WRE44564.1 restriction endonuclease subunit S [Helicobacter pylori]
MDALMLPLNWQRVRLVDICEIKRGVRITKNELDVFGKYPVVSGGVGFLGYTNNFNRYENTITIAQYGTAGYVNFQKNKFWANDVCFCIYPNKDIIKNIFLYYFLKVNQNYLYEISNRNATPYSISKDKILDFEIPLPPLNEQSAIADILSGLDRYLCALRALILKKESVKKALSFELLSQRKRLKGFNQNWKRVRLGDIANYLTSNLSAEQITQQGKIKVYDVNNFIGYTNTTFISDKPYISTVKDGSVGRVRILPPKTNILSTMGALVANHKTTTEFLFYLLSNFDFKNFTSGSIIPHIYFKDYKKKTIFLPPPLDEQIAIANILSDLDNEIASLKNKKRQFENIKKALNHDLMSAKIRVLKK